MFRNVERPLEARWACTLPRLLAEMARTMPPRQKDGATTAAGLERVSRSLIHRYNGAYATHLLVGELDGVSVVECTCRHMYQYEEARMSGIYVSVHEPNSPARRFSDAGDKRAVSSR